MTPKEHLINRLTALCKAHGVDAVAENANVSAENLQQIIDGRLLPSKAPRGVGPTVQRKLDAAYPGWSGLGKARLQPVMTIESAIVQLGKALAEVPGTTRRAVLGILQNLVDAPNEAAELAVVVRELLAAAKRRSA